MNKKKEQEFISKFKEQPNGSVNIDIGDLLGANPEVQEALALMDDKDKIFSMKKVPNDSPEGFQFEILLSKNPKYREAKEKVQKEKIKNKK